MAQDELSYSGLTTKTNLELVSELQTFIQTTYSQDGEEINFEVNSPDRQLTEILAEMGTVVRQLATDVYNSFDPTKCGGAVQDSRYQINYLTRKVGTYTQQNIDITVNQTVTLDGLDGAYNEADASAYTVSDNNGQLWYLIDTTTLYAGTTSCAFRAKEIGEIIPVIGTITNQVTIVQGVTKVINDVGYTVIGTEEESDADFRIRREQSVSLISGNNNDTILANILNLTGVTSANLYCNNTNSTDANGTPAHYIWLVVAGGANSDIANVLYENLSGAGTRGSVTVPLLSASLQTVNINFDRPTIVPLYIKFDLQPTVDLGEINMSDIKDYIATNLIYTIGEDAETSRITDTAANAILADGGGAYALNVQVSTGGTATASIGASTGITSATVNVIAFQAKMGDTTGSYAFSYDGSDWKYNLNVITLSDYGIAYSGTAISGDSITISYTQSTWSSYIVAPSVASQFVTDSTKITITPIV